MREATQGVVIGKVTNNADPANEGRIEVMFPWLGDDQPRWLSVTTPMGGAGRGLFMMPEIGDEALVAFQHGDFSHGYIVGFLWNPQHRPPTSSPRVRGLFSEAGHSLQFIDSENQNGNKGVVILKDAHDNMITMTNGVMSIFAPGHLDIQASSMTIMGRNVNPMGSVV